MTTLTLAINQGPPWWLFVSVPVGVIAMSACFSYLSGWRELARVYRTKKSKSGRLFRLTSIALGAGRSVINYRSMICLGIEPDGIYASNLDALFHRPLFIPKCAIVECKREKYSFFTVTSIYFQKPNNCMKVHGMAGNAIYNWWLRAHPDTQIVQ